QQTSSLTQLTKTVPNILPALKPAQQVNTFAVGAAPTSLTAALILGNTRSTTADSAGNFYFTDLPTSGSRTKVIVRMPGASSTYEFKVDIRDRGVDYDMGDVILNMTTF